MGSASPKEPASEKGYDFSGNAELCGKPLNIKCESKTAEEMKKRRKMILMMVMAAIGACLLSLSCCFYIYTLLKWRKKLKQQSAMGEKKHSPGKVKHRNITVLRGYYAGPTDLRLLVYDYMPNGNLSTLLQEASHQDGHVLNWPMRHLIALGISRRLGFLHQSTMVHGDIKPQNVLFDADFEAHLSDFGLDRLMVRSPSRTTITSATIGH